MTDDELRRHLADILLCCGVPAGQVNSVAVNRLRLAVDLLTAPLLDRLAAENARFRAALQQVVEYGTVAGQLYEDKYGDDYRTEAEIARAALTPEVPR